METRGTTGEETTSYWFDLPIDVAEFEEKLGVGAESTEYRIIEKVLPFADEVHEHTTTIDEAMNSPDPAVQENFKRYFGNKRPTPEEYIYKITKKTKV